MIVFGIQLAGITNHGFKRVCQNLHTLQVGMQPVFHQVFEVGSVGHDTGVFDIDHSHAKVICHLSDILIEISGLILAYSERKQGHHIDLRVGISLLHLVEGDCIGLHGVCRLSVSKCAVFILGDQCIKVYIFKSSKH